MVGDGEEPRALGGGRLRAVLLDALGTIVELEPPAELLADALGVEPGERLRKAVREEMSYYRAHATGAGDAASLQALRRRCAAIVSERSGHRVSVEQLMASIRFRAYDDAVPALRELRARGLRLVCVSNWDCGLGEVLARVGLDELLDGAVSSAELGVAKPDPAPFHRGLELAGCAANEAMHVGDRADEDVAGANAAGIRALLIDRTGGGDGIGSLGELPGLIDAWARPGDGQAAPT